MVRGSAEVPTPASGRPDPGARCWPLTLWAAQLVPGALLLAVASASVAENRWAAVAMLAASAWLALASCMLATARGRAWLVRRRREWLLAAASALGALAVADLLLGGSGLAPDLEALREGTPTYTFHRYSGYRLVPQTIRLPGRAIAINARGFRGPEVEAEKPRGRQRVVFLGGSQVFDFSGGDWPNRAGELLRATGLDVDVVNAGVPGHTSVDSLSKLTTDLWTLAPDVVFICHGWNDVKYFPRIAPARPYRELPPAAPLTLAADWRLYPRGLDRWLSASSIYRMLRVQLLAGVVTEEGHDLWLGPREVSDAELGPMGPQQLRLNLSLLVQAAAEVGARAALCKQAFLREGRSGTGVDVRDYIRRNSGLTLRRFDQAFAAADAAVVRVGEDHRVAVLDMRGPLAARSEHFVDAVHFGMEGSEAAARVVAGWLGPVLAARRDARRADRHRAPPLAAAGASR